MKKKIFLAITVLFFWTLSSHAQHLIPLDEKAYIHHLEKQTQLENKDSIRLISNLLLAEYWAATDSLKSKNILNKVQNDLNKVDKLNRVTNYFRGTYYYAQGNKKNAISYFEKSINDLKPYNDGLSLQLLALSYYQFDYLQLSNKGYQSMVATITEKCIPLAKKINNKELQAYFYTQMGLAFMSVGQFEKAEEQHNIALSLLKSSAINSTHLITYLNKISNYCYQANSAAAKPFLDQSTSIINQYPNSLHSTNYYYQLAMYQTTKTEYDTALETLKKGIQLAKAKNQNQLLQLMHFRMYNVYLMKKDYVQAKKYMEGILNEGILTQEAVNRKIVYTQMAYVNEVLNNPTEALQWLKKANTVSDSLQQANLLEKMNELEILHRTAEQKNTIDSLNIKQIRSELIAKNNNIKLLTVLAVSIVLLLISFILFITYKNQKKLNQQISINHQQEIQRLENEKKYTASKAILVGEENERKRIAQDLHDSVGSMLAAIRMKLDQDVEYKIPLHEIQEQIQRSIQEVRRISRNIMSETLQNRGLEYAIQELTESINTVQINFHFEAFDISKNISKNIQLTLYRICQEAVSNIIKYAKADEVIIQLSQDQNEIRLTIEDNGIGFDKETINKGLGLNNMKNRMELLNGSILIQSAYNQGTTIEATCPLNP